MNRKLIRTTLAEVKEREQQLQQQAPQPRQPQPQQPQGPTQPKKKVPPEQTNAEIFYYKKQMDSKTPMVIIMQDGEELRGFIEWYDKGSIKLHRYDAPNLLVLKHNIKYMYKNKDRAEEETE